MGHNNLKTLSLAHLPPGLVVHAALFSDLQNARFLRKQLLDGNSEFEYAFIDARMVLSEAHLLAAVFRAANDMSHGRMKSRNVHSEIVFAMSPNNNIAESFRKFGMSDSTRSLLVIKLAALDEAEAIAKQLDWAVEAKPLQFGDATLAQLSDVSEIRKVYKLIMPAVVAKLKAGADSDGKSSHAALDGAERNELEGSILGLMALRGAT